MISDSVGRNYGETFDLVWRMQLVDSFLKSKVDVTDIDTETRDQMQKTVTHLNRIFRGTDGRMPGVVFHQRRYDVLPRSNRGLA